MSEDITQEPIEEAVEEKPAKLDDVKDVKDDKKGKAKPEKVKKQKVKKKGKGKVFAILSVILLLLAGGGFAGAAFMGLIPGVKLGSKPAAKKAAKPETKEAEKNKEAAAGSVAAATSQTAARARPVREAAPEVPAKKKAPQVVIDPDKGAKALARIWEKMEPEKLAEIAGSYKDLELARVMRGMEAKKAAALLSLLPAERAGKLSQEMEKLASRVVPASGT